MKLRQILCCVLIAVILAGCVQTGGQTDQTTVPTAAPTTEPTAEPTTTVPEIELQAVNQLSFRQAQEAPTTCVIDGRTAAFVTVESKGGTMQTFVQVLDLYTDTLLADTALDGELTPMKGHCEGYLVLLNAQAKAATVFDSKMNVVLQFQVPSVNGILLPDLQTYYYIWGSQLRSMQIETGADNEVVLDPALPVTALVGYDFRRDVLIVRGTADVYSSDGCLFGVDLETMACVMLQYTSSEGTMAMDGVCMTGEAVDEFRSGIVYADWNTGNIYTYPEFLHNDKDYNTWHISGTNYCFKIKYDPESNTKAAGLELYRLGEQLEVCSLMEPMEKARLKELFALPDGNLLGISVTRRGFQPYIICPEKLEFRPAAEPADVKTELVDQIVITLHQQAQDNLNLPEELLQLRTQADDLGEKYGVTVLLSNQCTSALSASGMEIITTDQAEMDDEAGAIREALEILDKALALYPADFFTQFQDEAGEHGLLILLVESFSGDERGVIGLCYEMYPWYTIAVDLDSGEVYNTYCHEIWHATENRLNDITPGLLLPEVWDPCNPEEFAYSYNTSASYREDVEYTFFEEDNINRVYFVDAYGKTNAYEDRARLMEYVMCSSYAEELVKSPAIAQKLTIMCDAIRRVFDTEAWQDVYWERFQD